jgi:hypothetical protein
MKTVMFSFKDVAERDAFLNSLKETNNATINAALEAMRFDAPVRSVDERFAALWVSGTRIMEGPLAQVERMFKQECASHNAKVEIKEHKNGEWQRIKIRTKA